MARARCGSVRAVKRIIGGAALSVVVVLSLAGCGRIGYGSFAGADANIDEGVDASTDEGVVLDMPMLVDMGVDEGTEMDMFVADLGLDEGVDMGPVLVPGVDVSPTSGLSTSESGTTADFAVRLLAPPTDDVTIAIESSDETEATVSTPFLSFTSLNWAAPQTVTVTGVDDVAADGDQSFTITLAPAESSDLAYDGLDGDDVSGENRDNETPGVFVTPTSGLLTTEEGGTATFTIVLNNAPGDDVTISLATSDGSEGAASPASLTFTSMNWDAPQTVTVTGADDLVADGNIDYTIVTGATSSLDAAYNALPVADVAVTNQDDETPAILVSPLSGLMTSEAGLIDTFGVRLATQPTSDVVLDVESLDTSEGTVSPGSLTFTSMNWNATQLVTLSGVDDVIIDGAQLYTVRVTPNVASDAVYAAMTPIDVTASNTDNETAGVTVTPSSGLEVSEMGDTASFVITLNSQPTASVLIPLSSTDTTEGTVAPPTVSFTPATWNTPRTVTITGVNDAISDGNQMFTITTGAVVSGDSDYVGIDPTDVSVTNIDDDSPSIIVTPTTIATSEGGGFTSFTIRLGSMPTAGVTVPIMSSDTTEATVSPSSISFNTFNYATPQVVTVMPVDDLFSDGNQPFTIVLGLPTTTDVTYAAINPTDVTGTNADNESTGIVVSPNSGLVTTEGGAMTSFTVRLLSVPTANVTIGVSSSDLTEGTVSPATLTFTTLNGTNPLTVTVTGVNDMLADGDQAYSIVLATAVSADGAYNGLDPSDVSVTNTDNDVPNFLVTPLTVQTAETGTTAMISVSLTAGPSSDVVLGVSSSNTAEATVSPATLTFTPGDFAAAHVVTVTGVNDAIIDGIQGYTVITAAASSTDGAYNGMNPVDVAGTNSDDDYIVTNGSVNTAGVQANLDTGAGDTAVQISYDGRFIAFRSYADNLVAGDTNSDSDCFVRDMQLNTTERVSVGTDGSQAPGVSASPLISADGRYVVFMSNGAPTWTGYTGAYHTWIRDRTLGTTTIVSLTSAGSAATGSPSALSSDARYVLFNNAVNNTVPGDTNGRGDLFIRDRTLLTTTRATLQSGGAQYTTGGVFAAASYGPSVSDDGRFVVFSADMACNITADAGKTDTNVFLRDTMANTTVLLSFTTAGVPGRAQSMDSTPDGRYVLLYSYASVYVAGDTSTYGDVYVYDRLMGTFEVVSVSTAGVLGNQFSWSGSISDDGRYVAFESAASNLVAGDSNGQNDVFVRDRMLHTTRRQSVSQSGAQGNGISGQPVISGDGNWIVFRTAATNLFPGDTNGHIDCLRVPRL